MQLRRGETGGINSQDYLTNDDPCWIFDPDAIETEDAVTPAVQLVLITETVVPVAEAIAHEAEPVIHVELITVKDGVPTTSTLAIAERTGVQHKNIMDLVRTYQNDLEDFGEVAFETRLNFQGSPTEYAILNQAQSTLTLTYMRNTDVVRTFKKNLVSAFCEMAALLHQPVVVEAKERLDQTVECWTNISKLFYPDEGMAKIAANGAVRRLTGIDVMLTLEHPGFPQQMQEMTYTPACG